MALQFPSTQFGGAGNTTPQSTVTGSLNNQSLWLRNQLLNESLNRFQTLPGWDELFGFAEGIAGGVGGGAGGVAGGSTQFPEINLGPVYDQNAIQAQSNLLRGLNTAQAAGDVRDLYETAGARGFGSNSPAIFEIANQIQGRARASSTEADNNLRYQAALANAGQSVKNAELNMLRSRAISDDIIRRGQLGVQAQLGGLQGVSSLLAALSGFVPRV